MNKQTTPKAQQKKETILSAQTQPSRTHIKKVARKAVLTTNREIRCLPQGD